MEPKAFYVVGDRVLVDHQQSASVAYFGEVDFAAGDWVGLVLDQPSGNHEGKLHGRQYFQCARKHGLFVRPNRVCRLAPRDRSDSAIGSSSNSSSRNSTPLWNHVGTMSRPQSSLSTGSSLADSYFYDDDYRRPTVASLLRRLKSVEDRPSPAASQQQPLVGILKKGTRSPRPETPVKDVGQSPSSVFNFRPKRTSLEDYTLNQEPSRLTNRVRLSQLEPIRLNERVLVSTECGQIPATVRYIGETEFATGEWLGLELDTPDGKNDGSVLGQRYFFCSQNHGLFLPPTRVDRLLSSGSIDNKKRNLRATISSPPPLGSSFSDLDKHSHGSVEDSSSILESSKSRSSYPFSGASSYPTRQSNFGLKSDDSDTDSQTRRSHYEKSAIYRPIRRLDTTSSCNKPNLTRNLKSVKYTFATSEYDGDPIALRTVEYA